MSDFESKVKRAINKEFPGLFQSFHRVKYATTATGQRCAVFVNQGLTCTDVILYYCDSQENLKTLKETFFFVVKATEFSMKLLELISQERYAEIAWQEAVKLVIQGGMLAVKNAQIIKGASEKKRNQQYNYN